MKLIYIRSTMEPKNYSTIRSILKKEQGEKIAPYIFKLADTKSMQTYLDKERITYKIYQEERERIIELAESKRQEIIKTKKYDSADKHLDTLPTAQSIQYDLASDRSVFIP